jgi:hypothetical protein
MHPIGHPYKTLTREGSSNPSTHDKLDLMVVIADEIRQVVNSGWKAVDTLKIFVSFEANNLV